jgi:malate dehydrogenase (oxaloacetate-decarboxylating)(NADP+)
VAKAAMETGVAQHPVDLDAYRDQLEKRLGKANEIMRVMIHKAQRSPRRVVFPEGEENRILRAAHILLEERMGEPVLIGREEVIRQKMAELHLSGMEKLQIVNPETFAARQEYVEEFYRLRQRKGVARREAEELLNNQMTLGAMMVHMGDADAMIGGLTTHYPETIRPALQVIQVKDGRKRVAGIYIVITPRGHIYFLADCTVNIEPAAEDLAEIAIMTAEVARRFDVEPRVALLSFSNFGSTRHPAAEKVRRAVEIIQRQAPDIAVDGEMQADTAVVPEILAETYPFNRLQGAANVLIFPNLESGNIAYKLLARIGGAEVIGPILVGLSKPVHVLQRASEVNDIVNMAAIAVVEAQGALGRPAQTPVVALAEAHAEAHASD